MTKEYDMVPGVELSPSLRQRALQSYSHRFTGTHMPAWTKKAAPNGKFYSPQYKDDTEWLKNTMFPVVYEKGHVTLASGNDAYCHSSSPSFPWGEWRTEPFKAGTPLPVKTVAPEL